MTVMTRIRLAQLDDAPSVADLATQLGYPVDADEAASRLARLAQTLGHAVFVAERDGKVCGWAHVEHRFSLETGARAELMGLVVDAACRGTGVGKQLVAALEAWAAGEGLAILVVRSNVIRDAAHAFYRQLGYQAAKSQHVFQKTLAGHAHRA